MERYLKCTVIGEGDEREIEVDIHGLKGEELVQIAQSLIKVVMDHMGKGKGGECNVEV